MNGLSAALPAVLLVAGASLAGQASSSSPPSPALPPASQAEARSVPPPTEAAYQFAVAKLLAAEGSLEEALAAFEAAGRLAPDSPYVFLEHGQLLARLAQYSRAGGMREEYLQRAAAVLERARALAPENVDVLRTVGGVHLELAAQDPAALATAQEALEAVRRRDPDDPQAALTLAQIYLDQRQPQRAAEILRELVIRLPQQRMAYALLVEALLRADRSTEAEKVLGDILGFDPGSLEARLTLAELLSERGEHPTAVETLRGAPEGLRQEPRLRRQLAWELYRTGDMEGALETVDALLGAQETGPDRPFLSLVKGLALGAEGRHGEALEILSPLLEAQPDNVPLALTVARVLRRDGAHAEAARRLAELADRLAKQGKTDEARDVRLELVQAHFEAEEWSEVAAAVAPLLASEEEAVRAQALLLQADAMAEQGRHADALALLDKGGAPAVQARRAEVLSRSGDEREAKRLLSDLAASGEPASILAAAQALQRLERYAESVPLLEELAGKQQESVPARFLLGVAYERTGQRARAVAEFQRVLEIAPDFHAAMNYLGYTWAEAGENLDEALALVRRAVAMEPDNGAYVDSLGWTYHRLGRHELALGYLERANRLEPADATLQEHLGDVYVALGQKERARDAYRRALDMADENAEQVRQKLEQLRDAGTPRR